MIRPEKNVTVFSYRGDGENSFMNGLQKGKKKPLSQQEAWWRRKVKFAMKGMWLVLWIDVNLELL